MMKKLLSFLLTLSLFMINFSMIGSHSVSATDDLELLKKKGESLCNRVDALKVDMDICQNKHNIIESFFKELYEKAKSYLIDSKNFPLVEGYGYLLGSLKDKNFDYSNFKKICDNVKKTNNLFFSKGSKFAELEKNYNSLLPYEEVLLSNLKNCTKHLDKVKKLRDFMNSNNCLDPKSDKPANCYNVIDTLSLNRTLLKLVAEQELKD